VVEEWSVGLTAPSGALPDGLVPWYPDTLPTDTLSKILSTVEGMS
jgi:hypothetical protein